MDQQEIRSYRDLSVWQKAIALSVSCYRMTVSFPREEAYGMTTQIRRASVSVAANIAEGTAGSIPRHSYSSCVFLKAR
jgi:four helix bundle protein